MDKVILEYSTKVKTIYQNYTNNVKVYEDRVEITREGKCGVLLKNCTMFFDDITSISSGDYSRVWISFLIPGNQGNNNLVRVYNDKKLFQSNTPMEIPYNDSYTIMYGTKEKKYISEHYQIITETFNAYKKKAKNASGPAVIVEEGNLDKLKKLKELYDLGILNQDEYEEKKKKLLENI